jgi:hypothetical protein
VIARLCCRRCRTPRQSPCSSQSRRRPRGWSAGEVSAEPIPIRYSLLFCPTNMTPVNLAHVPQHRSSRSSAAAKLSGGRERRAGRRRDGGPAAPMKPKSRLAQTGMPVCRRCAGFLAIDHGPQLAAEAFVRTAAAFATSLLLIACSGNAAKDTADGSVTATQCGWSASLDDSGPGGCSAARVLVSCTLASGAGCGCVSNGPIECSSCGPANGATCKDVCALDEYVVACGGIGPPPADAAVGNTQPPSACHFSAAVPAGIAYYCCPCE